MMGRNHAMLGGVTFLLMRPMSEIPLNKINATIEVGSNRLHIVTTETTFIGMTIAWLVVLAITIFTPAALSTKSRNKLRASAFRYLEIAVVFVSVLFVSQWIGRLLPQLWPENPIMLGIWTFIICGWSVIPDIDEPNSTLSKMLWPVSGWFSRFIRRISGGHRRGTHSWVMVALGITLATLAQFCVPVAVVLMALGFLIASRLLVPEGAKKIGLPVMLAGAVIAILAGMGGINFLPMLLVVPGGILLHDLGDWLTNSGIPFWMPHNKKYAAKLFPTNGPFEWWVVAPTLTLVLAVCTVTLVVLPSVGYLQSAEVSQFFRGSCSLQNCQVR